MTDVTVLWNCPVRTTAYRSCSNTA